jgi:hypothetical protein
VWGDADYGGSGAPSGKGHTKIYVIEPLALMAANAYLFE